MDFIRNRSIVEGGTLNLTATAVDKTGGQALQYTLLTNPPGASIDKASGLLTWTATDSQAANFTGA